MPIIETTRFGDLEVSEKRVIQFPDGLIGFPQWKAFAILEHQEDSPLFWLQSLDLPQLAFLTIDPRLIKPDFLEALHTGDRACLGLEEGSTKFVLALITIPEGRVEEMTANLLAPVVIDPKARVGRQVILANSGLSTQHPVLRSRPSSD